GGEEPPHPAPGRGGPPGEGPPRAGARAPPGRFAPREGGVGGAPPPPPRGRGPPFAALPPARARGPARALAEPRQAHPRRRTGARQGSHEYGAPTGDDAGAARDGRRAARLEVLAALRRRRRARS